MDFFALLHDNLETLIALGCAFFVFLFYGLAVVFDAKFPAPESGHERPPIHYTFD